MKKTSTLLCYCLAALLTTSCIHQYPDSDVFQVQRDVTLYLQLLPDREFIPMPVITKSGAGIVPEGYLPRVIVEARRAGETTPALRVTMPLSEEELTKPEITLPVGLKLKSVPYDLTVWMDYVREESLPDAHYHTEDFCSVSYILPYEEDHLRRDAFVGNASIDLSEQEGQVTRQMDVRRPLAHYRLMATDVQEFLNKEHANGRPGAGEYDVAITYQYFLVTHLNAVMGEPINSGSGFGYTRRISLDDTMNECELAADYVLAGEETSSVTVIIEVRQKGGNEKEAPVLSRGVNLEIPYRRGHTTTVQGAFLSNKGGGGDDGSGGINIGIDGDYEGEINIDAGRH